MTEQHETDLPQVTITELSKAQRRVLGVLVEKAFTTPEYYPLTLKAVTAGCNQKSNRMPVVNYSEDEVADTLDQLRELGLAAVVHTESGRTERYRHYMRHRFPFTEPQLAVFTELLLRGRQQLGELRTRASRMVPIDSLEELRDVLHGLKEMNLIQTSGPLERRGAEVDHNWYRAKENQTLSYSAGGSADEDHVPSAAAGRAAPSPQPAAVPSSGPLELMDRLSKLESSYSELQLARQELTDEVQALKDECRRLQDQLEDLRRDLGG